MPDYSWVGAGHLAALMHRALKRGDAAALAALRAECARRTVADQEACRREWIRQCSRQGLTGGLPEPLRPLRGALSGACRADISG